MKDNIIREEYSSDKKYRYLICQEDKYFEVWLQKRITDEYMGPDWFTYTYIHDYKHVTELLIIISQDNQEYSLLLKTKRKRPDICPVFILWAHLQRLSHLVVNWW